jgi:hypothetical protein
MWHGEVFHMLGVQDVESLILVGDLFLLYGGRRRGQKKEKKKKKKNHHGEGRFPPGPGPPCWLGRRSQLSGTIKG